MVWMTWWPLVLGFTLSGLVQSFLPRDGLRARLGTTSPASVARASVLGVISSSCSYAASAMARALFARGASWPNALVFMVASTNLVVELGVVLYLFLGWQFVAAQFAGGAVMVVALALGAGLVFSPAAVGALRERVLADSPPPARSSGTTWRDRLRTPRYYRRAVHARGRHDAAQGTPRGVPGGRIPLGARAQFVVVAPLLDRPRRPHDRGERAARAASRGHLLRELGRHLPPHRGAVAQGRGLRRGDQLHLRRSGDPAPPAHLPPLLRHARHAATLPAALGGDERRRTRRGRPLPRRAPGARPPGHGGDERPVPPGDHAGPQRRGHRPRGRRVVGIAPARGRGRDRARPDLWDGRGRHVTGGHPPARRRDLLLLLTALRRTLRPGRRPRSRRRPHRRHARGPPRRRARPDLWHERRQRPRPVGCGTRRRRPLLLLAGVPGGVPDECHGGGGRRPHRRHARGPPRRRARPDLWDEWRPRPVAPRPCTWDESRPVSRRHSSVRAYGVLIDSGRIALVRSSNPRHDPPLWWLPGGGIDFAETPESALVREFLEEPGLAVSDPALLGVSADVRRRDNGDQIHTVRITYTVALVGGDLAHEVHGTTDHARWFTLDEVDALNLADYARAAIAAAQAK